MGRGQVLLLDWVSGPYTDPLGPTLGSDGNTLGGAPFVLLLRALRVVLGASVSSWLPLVAWMPVAGWGVGRLTRHAGRPAAASAAALACCNPFTLDRLAIGQVGVLWGYALLPLAVLTLGSEPWRRLAWAARSALVGAALTAVSPHYFAYWLVIVVASVALLPKVGRRALSATLAVGAALCASSYLLVVRQPSVTVDQADLSAYRTRVEPPGLAVTIMTLRGFWRFSADSVTRTPAAWALIVLVGACAAVGVVATSRWRQAAVLVVAGLVGAVLSAGDQGAFGGLYRFAFDHVAPFRILREPQKASSVLAIALSVFFGLGVGKLLSLLAGEAGSLARGAQLAGAAVLVAAPLGTAPSLPAFGWRAHIERPSAAWRQADRLVGSGPAGVLALPWHLYMAYPGTRSSVANLAPTRFRAPVVSGDNVELPGLATTSTRLRSRYLEERFRRGPELTDFGAEIEPAGLRWVLLVKSVDWTSYQWLDQQQDLERVLDTPELALYRSRAPSRLTADSASRSSLASWRVRSPPDGPVPLPEVEGGRWVAARGQVEVTEAGAPAILSSGTPVHSRNVREALGGLVVSGLVAVLLVLVAGLHHLRSSVGSRRRGHEAAGGAKAPAQPPIWPGGCCTARRRRRSGISPR